MKLIFKENRLIIETSDENTLKNKLINIQRKLNQEEKALKMKKKSIN